VTVIFAAAVDPEPFSALPGVRVQHVDGTVLRLAAPEPAMDGVVKLAAQHGIVDFLSEPADLEEIFLDLYREADHGS
jgi:hypothetical protein